MLKFVISILLFLLFVNFNSKILANNAIAEIDKTELHSMLLSYADTYLENVSQITDSIILETEDPYVRLNIHQVKVLYVTSVVNIVTEPAALQQLFDMVVMVRLQRKVWENNRLLPDEEIYAQRITDVLIKLEEQISKIADIAISEQEFELLVKVIDDWYRRNSKETSIAFVRFTDLGHNEPITKLNAVISKGGLLAPLRDAVREIKESRLTAERALFLANHAPSLLQWQMELFMYKLSVTPEAKSLLKSSQELGGSTTELIRVIEDFNNSLPNQSEIIIGQLSGEVDRQRELLVAQFHEILVSERDVLFNSMENSTESVQLLLERTQNSSKNINDATENIIHILDVLDEGSSEKMTTDEILLMLSESREISSNLLTISADLRQLLQADKQGLLENTNRLAIEHERRIFIYLLILVFVIFFLSAVLIKFSKKNNITV